MVSIVIAAMFRAGSRALSEGTESSLIVMFVNMPA